MTLEKKVITYTDSAICDLIKEFIHQYKDYQGNYRYVDLIDQCTIKNFVLFTPQDFIESSLDCGPKLYDILMTKPTSFLKGLRRAVKEIFAERYEQKNIDVGIDQVTQTPTLVEALGNQFVGKIVTVTGMAVSKSEMYNIPLKINFVCPDNHSTVITNIDGISIKEPVLCSEKSCKHRTFEQIIEPDDFERHRTIFIKSDDDFSFQSDELSIDLIGQLTESVEAGDRIQVTGIIKPVQIKKIYHNILKALWVKKLDDVDYAVSPDDEEIFRKIVDDPDFHSKMVNSMAPSILGYDAIKESLLLQRIGAPNRTYHDGTMDRGGFHIGLWGDGGVAKSRMGEWEENALPKTQMVGSRGATDKGLLLGIEEDASGKKSVRAGAFVRCRDGGVVILDEFPRLNPEVIDGLMTTLQSGIASISKAGHQARVRADAGLLATGNAFNEEWNPNSNLKDNLNMSTPLLQRFDYHWIIIDTPNEKKDRKIAQAKLYGNKYDDSKEPLNSTFLAKYCKFVRRFNPELSDEVSKHLEDKYVELRKNPESKDNGISPRHLDTMIRTTLSYARLYQRQFATLEDADNALWLLKINLSQRNISISEADTYLTRQYNRCIDILKNHGISGLKIDALFDELLSFGSAEEITTTLNDLGRINSLSNNKKWYEVVRKIRRSPMISIISKKPLILAYKNDESRITSWS